MDPTTVTPPPDESEPVDRRAIDLAVGDKIVGDYLPFRFSPGPGEAVYVTDHTYVGQTWVFAAVRYADGYLDCASFRPDAVLKVWPAAPFGLDHSRPADSDDPQPVAGRVPQRFAPGEGYCLGGTEGGEAECGDTSQHDEHPYRIRVHL